MPKFQVFGDFPFFSPASVSTTTSVAAIMLRPTSANGSPIVRSRAFPNPGQTPPHPSLFCG